MWTSGAAAWLLACKRTLHRSRQPAKAAWQSWAADGPRAGRSLERRMRPPYLTAILFLAASSLARADDLACVSTTFRFTSPSDKVCVSDFDDPKVPGVTCFISQARKGGWGQPFGLNEDPSNFSVSCHRWDRSLPTSRRCRRRKRPSRRRQASSSRRHASNRVPNVKRNALIYLAVSSKLIDGAPANAISVVPIMPCTPK
jgi:CreA protein